MLGNTKTFSSFSVKDIDRSQRFYETTLGLDVVQNEMGILELNTGAGLPVTVYPKPNHQPATFTVLNFTVKDIENVVDGLIAKGITFEQYDDPIKTDEKGICWSSEEQKGPNIAWFKDPDGNILSVIENTKIG